MNDRKDPQTKLEQCERRYLALFNGIPNPIFLLDEVSLEILDCNDGVKVLYGFGKEDLIGRQFQAFFRGDERAIYESMVRTSPAIRRARQTTREGKAVYVDMNVAVCEYPERKVLLVVVYDVTERMESELELIQSSKMATLGEMVAGVAHELNQPLSVIKTGSGFLMKKVKKGEKIDDKILLTLAEEMDRHVDRATEIVHHVLEFGRKSDSKLERIPVNDVLRKAFGLFGPQLRSRGIDVVWEIQEDLPLVMADENRLQQVLINLLVNARDAIEDKWKGRKPGKDDRQISLSSRAEKDNVIMEVRDKGIGIPRAVMGKIFEPFFTTNKDKGTGLGLSISRGIIQEWGGDIHAVSIEGEGATFIITLPAAYGR
jgi:histidine kinase